VPFLSQTPVTFILPGLKEYRKAANGWIMETLDNKPFKIKVNTEAEKKQIVSMMKYSIKCYEKQFKGHGWDCKITLPVALVTVGHLDLAIELLETFVHLNPTLSEGFYHLGTAFMMRDQPEALENAYQSLQSCVELEPNHYFARANLGMVCFMKGDLEEAKRVLVGVLSDSPTCVEAANNLAIVLVHRGEPGDLEFAESKVCFLHYLYPFSDHHTSAAVCDSNQQQPSWALLDLHRCAAAHGTDHSGDRDASKSCGQYIS
jgi:tetratricopeptide (TPR) repeat protein